MTNKSPGHQVVAADGSYTYTHRTLFSKKDSNNLIVSLTDTPANIARASLPVQHYGIDIPFTVSIAWSDVVSKPLLALHE